MLEKFSCPLPQTNYDTIQMAHGSGGKLSNDLLEKIFLPCFSNEKLNKNRLEDQAVIEHKTGRLSFSTDTFTVQPIFFPGGNIGELAVNGTVNDVCMNGAIPQFLSVGFIIEEGLPIKDLHDIVVSMRQAADDAGVTVVTGDTKVVNKGSCDQLFINTSGIGWIADDVNISAKNIKAGDRIIVSGTIADHGMAVMTSREGLSFENRILSDTAALNDLVKVMLSFNPAIHAMRDPTRGGVATTLNELAVMSGTGMRIYENRIPVKNDVRGACEILGIDPLHVANEGKLLAIVSANEADQIVQAMNRHDLGKEARIIGEVVKNHPEHLVMENIYGVERIIDMLVGEQLPRIC
ncbi:MAG: hydrogenase expression/formation protein HypE [Caldithrix sp.]|nr:hydrogenase expression/formation protein HypE [Caldithrix sp.]